MHLLLCLLLVLLILILIVQRCSSFIPPFVASTCCCFQCHSGARVERDDEDRAHQIRDQVREEETHIANLGQRVSSVNTNIFGLQDKLDCVEDEVEEEVSASKVERLKRKNERLLEQNEKDKEQVADLQATIDGAKARLLGLNEEAKANAKSKTKQARVSGVITDGSGGVGMGSGGGGGVGIREQFGIGSSIDVGDRSGTDSSFAV